MQLVVRGRLYEQDEDYEGYENFTRYNVRLLNETIELETKIVATEVGSVTIFYGPEDEVETGGFGYEITAESLPDPILEAVESFCNEKGLLPLFYTTAGYILDVRAAVKNTLDTLDVGGEQSRAFMDQIEELESII